MASSWGEGARSAVPRPLPGSCPAGASVSPGGRWTYHLAITSMSISLSCKWPWPWGHKVLHTQLTVTSPAAAPWPGCPEPPQKTPVPRGQPRLLLGPHPNSFLCPAAPSPRAPTSSHARDHTGKGHAGGREGMPSCPTVSGELGDMPPQPRAACGGILLGSPSLFHDIASPEFRQGSPNPQCGVGRC